MKKFEFPILFLVALVAIGAIIYAKTMQNPRRSMPVLAMESTMPHAAESTERMHNSRADVDADKTEALPVPLSDDNESPLPTPMPMELSIAPVTPVPDIGFASNAPTPSL